MAQLLPLTLSGDNLGLRHRYYNSQVNEAATKVTSFEDVEDLPEQSPVDRLFKIDLAIKFKNFDYILKNIKDDDILYVTRALKCRWLLERHDMIHPKNLEDVLYPHMVVPAISKMKNWLYINLRDSVMCQEFYQYYKETKFNYAIKFLNRCGEQFVFNEFPKILINITPHYLKIFGETYPKLIKIYYESMATNKDLVRRYLKEEQIFYNNIKCVLKLDPDMFLDITEQYHSLTTINMFSSAATEYILRFHKNRFIAKSELYVAQLLHMPTVAKCLSVEECKEVVIKLARADYLYWWFSYENVEPLVKRVSSDERAAFKKRVFVEKDVGEHVAEWPYKLPASPVADDTNLEELHVFRDYEFDPILQKRQCKKRKILKRHMKRCLDDVVRMESKCLSVKSELQKLFDEFRFVSFEGTLYELKRRIRTVSSADRRRDMLLVLVSKSGGRTDAVRALLQLALTLRNEPVHERAAIIRSLMKRACAWRFPQDVWDTMLEYGRGLGLDGTEAEADCREGLHALVMRQLIATGNCEPSIRTAFITEFTTFDEYKLDKSERAKIGVGLQNILMAVAADTDSQVAAYYLNKLLDVLEVFHIRIESSQAVSAIAALAKRDLEVATPLLERLYGARVARRELLREYLTFQHDDAALLNALQHDPGAFSLEWLVQLLVKGETRATRFLYKLAVYFTEKGGFADRLRQLLLETLAVAPCIKLARPLAIVAGSDMSSILNKYNFADNEHWKLAAELRANMHQARPASDTLILGWRKAGLKAIAWQAMRCRPVDVNQIAQSLLEERKKRTVRLALALALRSDCIVDLFSAAVTIRPLAALRAALIYFRRFGAAADVRIWNIVKSLISITELGPREGLRHMLEKVEYIPKHIKPDYCAILALALDDVSMKEYVVLSELMKLLPKVNDDVLDNVMLRMLENMDKPRPKTFPAVIIRYLMLSRNEIELNTRFGNIGEPFFNKVDAFRTEVDPSTWKWYSNVFEQIMMSLQFNYAFFDIKYQCCLQVIERVLLWMQTFLPMEMHFNLYIKIHAVMLYYKAIRQSMNQKPEIFEDHEKKMCEGVEVVGFTFGRYIAKELTELMSKYFDSVIEIYRRVFIDYVVEFFDVHSESRENFIAAVAKGILFENVGKEALLAIHIFAECRHHAENEDINELMMKVENNETKFFFYAELAD